MNTFWLHGKKTYCWNGEGDSCDRRVEIPPENKPRTREGGSHRRLERVRVLKITRFGFELNGVDRSVQINR